MTEAPFLEVRGIRKTYTVSRGLFRGKTTLNALRGVSLRIGRGQVLGLVGESGSGKSTLARIMTGLEQPTEGSVLIAGKDLVSENSRDRTRLVQPIFQDPYSSLNPRRLVAAQIGLPLMAHGIGTKKERERRVAEMAELVGLPRRVLEAPPNELSGGQRQRVAIARALILHPPIVVCDEPTSALDVSVQAQILNLLRNLQRELHLTYVLISHDLSVVQYMSDEVAVMHAGKIVENGPADAVLSAPQHAYTKVLLGSVLVPDPDQGLPRLDAVSGDLA